MKEFFKNFNEVRKNKRIMALIKLGFWFCFFGIIIIFLNIGGTGSKGSVSTPKVEETELTRFLNLESYKFNYQINDQLYTGVYYDNQVLLTYEDKTFYINENIIKANQENLVLPEYEYLFKNKLYDLIYYATLDATTSYKDGRYEYTYINNSLGYDIIVKYEVVDGKISKVKINDNIQIEYYDYDNLDFVINEEEYIYQYSDMEDENEY